MSTNSNERNAPEALKRACAACGASPAEPQLCSGCRVVSYCNRECQRSDWKTHKPNCCQKPKGNKAAATSTSAGSCPYKPTGAKSGGHCPYRDHAEEAELQAQINACLTDGLTGMDELFHLSKSGEMISQEPLRNAVGDVLEVLEKNDLNLTSDNVEYVLKAGQFISGMMHWTENVHVIENYFGKLACIAFRVLMTPNATPWAVIYTTILTRLNSVNTIKCGQFLQRVQGNMQFRAAMEFVAADEEWMKMPHRAKFVNNALNNEE